ncbi:arylamine N-acetyltransferase family protein [Caulobacter mirabilis]|uniref:Arylamine N-acetyltransferase n=1 Tax=Caulobacter mirabilis TaxID=69666 RepID=A0A2D2AZE7_9CAUL|nr:arylamine N-acetyltransferase [Caulobacter mirabilis]ATQ43390.1 arylamine N-acetyltransferase [Caulobacter mirabilis]
MTVEPNLDAYFARIGYAGPRAPTPELLKAIVARHPVVIPFENLNPFLGLPVDLDVPALEAKLVRGGRGGYCFEQNGLLLAVLRALGFEAEGLLARVIWNLPVGAVNARTHMIIRVNLDGRDLLVDVGLGGMTLTGVLELTPDVEQETPHETFRLLREDALSWRQEARVKDEWRATYRFDLTRAHPIDYVVGNYYTATHPASHFTHSLLAARVNADRRHALRGLELAVHHLGGPTERRTLGGPQEVEQALEEVFHIALPAGPMLRERLSRLF